jgi:hypothetical protein
MENTMFVGFHGTRLSRVTVTAAWKQRGAWLLAAPGIDTSPTDDNSTGVSATGRCRT